VNRRTITAVVAGVFAFFMASSYLHGTINPAISEKTQAAGGQGAFATHRYRNLFAEDGHPRSEIDAKLQVAFHQLFHGNPETESVYFASGTNQNGNLAYITDWANHDVRTEGMSYGMMITVQMNKKTEFDALWNWANTYMYISDPKHPSFGFFSWSCKIDGTPNEETPAPDGEEYFAMSLYFASARWGDGKGIYDYHAQADALLRAMRHRQQIIGNTRFGVRDVAAEVDEDHRMIRFVPGVRGRDFTDPSYHLPAFYELWARWGPVEDRTFWNEAAVTSRKFFVATTDPKTGLAPTYANFDGTPHATHFPQSSTFGYDAWRTASNWSVDWSWWRADPVEPLLSDRIQNFFASQGTDYGELYTLDGKVIDSHHAPGLVAVNAVASLAASDRKQARQFTEALWQLPIPSGHGRYYDGMLYMLSMLHVSGQFRIWTPRATESASTRGSDSDLRTPKSFYWRPSANENASLRSDVATRIP
jgi:oligosaccharide reducing-end xylanase